MSTLIDSYQKDFEKIIEFLKREITSLRTSRASSVLVENLIVEAYGTKMPLKQLAGITVPEARTILIEPWDKNNLKNIEKAFQNSGLGLTPIVENNLLRISVPPLNEEKRKELVRLLHQKAESARIAVRGVRDKIREEIFQKERKREIGEDEKYRLFKELDEKIKKINEEIENLIERKEKEIVSI
ncbi:MAG: ribosome recycling factor [Patescibacteria group bacterium]|nr:ribosome recycling factor [Patescibacteria group bacterium]